MSMKSEPFGTLPDGTPVEIYTLTNRKGIEARVMTYGATLVSLRLPDRNGRLDDVNLGFDDLAGYLGPHPCFGVIVGRYANRIARGKFTLDGVTYTLARNNNGNSLHGGLKGFDKVVWKGEPVDGPGAVGVKLTYLSKDMEEGYPGNLAVTVVYTLTEADELKIAYEAVTDKATPVNLSNHAYWNLAGQGRGDILGHVLELAADKYTAVDSPVNLIPTGEIKDVKGTPLDFTAPHAIGERIGQVEGGYDHNFVLRSGGGRMARRPGPSSRRPAGSSRSSPTSLRSSSIRGTSSTARSRARAGSPAGSTSGSASRRSISPIRQTTRTSPRPSSSRGKSTRRSRSTSSL